MLGAGVRKARLLVQLLVCWALERLCGSFSYLEIAELDERQRGPEGAEALLLGRW